MKIWIDAHISPSIAAWIKETFGIEAKSLRSLGLRESKDYDIFLRAKAQDAIFITKDSDFLHLVEVHGTPPQWH